MTPADLSATLATLGLSRKDLAERLGVHPVTVRKWMAGMVPVPDMVAAYLAAQARADRAEAALRKGVRWNDDGPCWCNTRRLSAVQTGTKIHTRFCEAARAALTHGGGDDE